MSQTFDFAVLATSWLLVRARIHGSSRPPEATVDHMYRYFGYFALFNLFMALPFVFYQSGMFPIVMAWGYVIANIFLLVSLSHISRMTLNMLTRFARFDGVVTWIWWGLVAVMTALNGIVIGMQHQPTYDVATRVAHYAIPAWMGAMLGMISFLAYLSAIGVLVYGALHQHRRQRVRTILLILGLLIIMVVGPLHAVAANWETFLIVDVLNMVSLTFLTIGVMYRISQPAETLTEHYGPRPGWVEHRLGRGLKIAAYTRRWHSVYPAPMAEYRRCRHRNSTRTKTHFG